MNNTIFLNLAANDCATIGCLYGYGKKDESVDADYLINDINELKKLL